MPQYPYFEGNIPPGHHMFRQQPFQSMGSNGYGGGPPWMEMVPQQQWGAPEQPNPYNQEANMPPYGMYGNQMFHTGNQMMHQTPYHNQDISYPEPMPYQPQPYNPFNGMLNNPAPKMQQPNGQSLFANPLQTKKEQQMLAQFPVPYPKQSFKAKPQTSGFQSIMNQFKTQDGAMDVTKMMNTAGQMMGTVSQAQSIFKGIGGIFKTTT